MITERMSEYSSVKREKDTSVLVNEYHHGINQSTQLDQTSLIGSLKVSQLAAIPNNNNPGLINSIRNMFVNGSKPS